jgi:hypothetical protein
MRVPLDDNRARRKVSKIQTNELKLQVYKAAMLENIITVLSSMACIGLVALGTGSLHCFWGLLLLINLNVWKDDA